MQIFLYSNVGVYYGFSLYTFIISSSGRKVALTTESRGRTKQRRVGVGCHCLHPSNSLQTNFKVFLDVVHFWVSFCGKSHIEIFPSESGSALVPPGRRHKVLSTVWIASNVFAAISLILRQMRKTIASCIRTPRVDELTNNTRTHCEMETSLSFCTPIWNICKLIDSEAKRSWCEVSVNHMAS